MPYTHKCCRCGKTAIFRSRVPTQAKRVVLELYSGKWSRAIGLSLGTNHGLGRNVLPEHQWVKVRPSGDCRDILGRSSPDHALSGEAAVQARGGAGL
jgi:hypothetical protein